jgi:UDP-N-acetylmuramoyl-tripeptide--D-alanyl-D-alanine ligase
MTFWTFDRVAAALRGQLVGSVPGGSTLLHGVSTDTRKIAAGDLFVALRGENFDAHDFLTDAVRAGAAAVVISDARRGAGLGRPVFLVTDTEQALGALGTYRRRAWGRPVIAVAGSNGKSSTKELVRAALSGTFEVHATTGNLNNQIGVPLTLLALPDSADVAVVEVGTNHPGEVDTLRAIVEPDIAIVTSIGEEHLEGLVDLAGVLREESAILRGVAVAITPSSQPEIGAASRALAMRTIEAGLDAGEVRPTDWGLREDGRAWLLIDGERLELPLLGQHNARNAMLALATASALGMTTADACRGLASLTPMPMRNAPQDFGAMTIINDAYNANPASAREALALLDAVSSERPRAVVLGTMLELGTSTEALHDEIASRAMASRAVVIAGIGEFARAFARVAPGDSRVVAADTLEELWPALSPRLPRNAIVLLKGSRGMRLERLVPKLAELAGVDTAAPLPPATPVH